MLKVLVVDDEKYIRLGLIKIINDSGNDFKVIGEAINGHDALQIIETSKPDIVVTDIKMPLIDGVEFTKLLKQNFPKVKIIVLSGFDNYCFVRETMKNGAVDYLLKPVDESQLIELLKKIQTDIEEAKKTGVNKDVSHIDENNNHKPETYNEILQKAVAVAATGTPANKKDKLIIQNVKAYIDKNYDQAISLNKLAEIVYVNPNYLSELYKNETGENVIDYITKVRVEKAKELLKDIKFKVYEISEMVGYSDSAYFSKVFKKIVGVSPLDYKNVMR